MDYPIAELMRNSDFNYNDLFHSAMQRDQMQRNPIVIKESEMAKSAQENPFISNADKPYNPVEIINAIVDNYFAGMPPQTEPEKKKLAEMYGKSILFFEKNGIPANSQNVYNYKQRIVSFIGDAFEIETNDTEKGPTEVVEVVKMENRPDPETTTTKPQIKEKWFLEKRVLALLVVVVILVLILKD